MEYRRNKLNKKITVIAILILFAMNAITAFAYDPLAGRSPPNCTRVVGVNSEYIFVWNYVGNKVTDYPKSGLYTNDSRKQLIYSLPDFCREITYVSDDGFTVLVEEGLFFGFNKLNQPIYTLYKKGEVVKQYKLSALYNFSFELHNTSDGYIWQSNYQYDQAGNMIYIKTYNGRNVSINTLTGEMTKTPSYFDYGLMAILFITIVIVLIKIVKKKKLLNKMLHNKSSMRLKK